MGSALSGANKAKSDAENVLRVPVTSVARLGTSRRQVALLVVLSYCLIGVIATLPRVLDLGRFATGDEMLFWTRRAEAFLRAVQTRHFADTAISTHPGVTTMWLGSAGILLRRWMLDHELIAGLDFPHTLMFFRLPAAIVHSLGVVAGYALLRRLLPAMTALLAALLWATDPYLIGYSRMLHVDALAGTFMALSILAACVFWHNQRRWSVLVLSGICAGLAILSKSPALVILPVVGLTALFGEEPGARSQEPGARSQKAKGSSQLFTAAPLNLFSRSFVVPLLAWALVCGLTVFALWPALWGNPIAAYNQLRVGVEVEGNSPHVSGNFFLGQEQAIPGVLYYPVALVLASTPLTLVGLLLLPLAWWRLPAAPRRDVATWALTAALFVVALSLFEKKLDRYLVPIAPIIDVLAAVGIMWLPTLFIRYRVQFTATLVTAITLFSVANVAFWQPYYITAYNQLFGGTATGTRTFLVGIGEGMDQVADWLNQQPDITGVITASAISQTIQPYMRKGARIVSPDDGKLPKKTGYVVVSVRELQHTHIPPPYDRFYGVEQPVQVIKLNGVDYFWIYRHDPTTP